MQGLIRSVDEVLKRIDDETKVIPGHGGLGGKTELKAYRQMLATVHGRIQKLMQAGKSVDEIVAAKPTADLDAEWGDGFLKPDTWVRIVCGVMR